jgi:hypothetical protein
LRLTGAGTEAGHSGRLGLEGVHAQDARNRSLPKVLMKRLATWALYAVGALSIAYLALYAYVTFTGNDIRPGDPIHIFRKPDAPSYS